MKEQFNVMVPSGPGVAWCVETFDTLAKAKRAADREPGLAWVRKVTIEDVYRNGKADDGIDKTNRIIAKVLG